MRLCRPHCPPALGVPLVLLAVALAGPADAFAAFRRDQTPLSPAVTGDSSSAAHVSGGSGTAAFARMVVGLVIVIAVIFAVYYLLKLYGRSKTGGGALREDGQIEVLATTALAPSRSVHLIRVGNDLVLVGSSEGGVTPLRVYEPGDQRRLELETIAGPPQQLAISPGRRGSVLEELRRKTAR